MPVPEPRPVTLRMGALDWRRVQDHAETEALCTAITARHGPTAGEMARTLAMPVPPSPRSGPASRISAAPSGIPPAGQRPSTVRGDGHRDHRAIGGPAWPGQTAAVMSHPSTFTPGPLAREGLDAALAELAQAVKEGRTTAERAEARRAELEAQAARLGPVAVGRRGDRHPEPPRRLRGIRPTT